MQKTHNLRVQEFEPLVAPSALVREIPVSPEAAATVVKGREELRSALAGQDARLALVVGPCSIHDEAAALDYAQRLASLRNKVADKLIVLMRVYFEKPRTTVGWKGLINDPHLDGTYDIVHGLRLARRILAKVNDLGLPCATEFLDPIVPQYTSDLVAWAAIGARTTESQTHRQMASGLSMPVGFKNATNGSLQVALDAMVSACSPHAFVGIDEDGRTSVVKTAGNPDVHIVLRGSATGPNYSKADIAYTKVMLEPFGAGDSARCLILIDCSHGNSNKDYRRQPQVFQSVLAQYQEGERAILGMMLESHLVEGSQNIDAKPLRYGQSVTDACISWETTESLILEAYERL